MSRTRSPTATSLTNTLTASTPRAFKGEFRAVADRGCSQLFLRCYSHDDRPLLLFATLDQRFDVDVWRQQLLAQTPLKAGRAPMKWKRLTALFLAILLPTAASTGTLTQIQGKLELSKLPPPFGVSGPIIPGRQCSPQYQSLLKLQIEAFKRLQRLSRREGEALCATLEGANQLGVDKLIDPKALEPLLTQRQRELLDALGMDLSKVNVAKVMRLLGVDLSRIDLRQLKQQCRASRGELDRFATSELERVEAEIFRCGDWV
jgi:hypothetical protein